MKVFLLQYPTNSTLTLSATHLSLSVVCDAHGKGADRPTPLPDTAVRPCREEGSYQLAASWIGVKLHLIQAIQSGEMEGPVLVRYTHRFSYRQRYMFCGKLKNKIRLPRFFINCFSRLTLRKDCLKCDGCQLSRASLTSGSMILLCVSMLLSHVQLTTLSIPIHVYRIFEVTSFSTVSEIH